MDSIYKLSEIIDFQDPRDPIKHLIMTFVRKGPID